MQDDEDTYIIEKYDDYSIIRKYSSDGGYEDYNDYAVQYKSYISERKKNIHIDDLRMAFSESYCLKLCPYNDSCTEADDNGLCAYQNLMDELRLRDRMI